MYFETLSLLTLSENEKLISYYNKAKQFIFLKMISFYSVWTHRGLTAHMYSVGDLFGKRPCWLQDHTDLEDTYCKADRQYLYILQYLGVGDFYFHSYPSVFMLINHTEKLTYILHTAPLTALQS